MSDIGMMFLHGLTVYFWLWYLTWEATHYGRKNDDNLKWWEKDID